MNKKFVLALMLASGMAFAQSSGSSPGSSDQQQPSTQQPSTQQPSTQQPQQPSGQSPTSAGQSSLTGCLKGSDGGCVIVAEGQSTAISGDSSTLSPHNGHQVQVKGSQASDGSFQVTEVVMIADTCTKQEASAPSGTDAAAGAAAGAASGTADATKSAASAAQSATTPQTYSDQGAGTSQGAKQKMPQTASPLPLLGLLGFGSLVSGLVARRK